MEEKNQSPQEEKEARKEKQKVEKKRSPFLDGMKGQLGKTAAIVLVVVVVFAAVMVGCGLKKNSGGKQQGSTSGSIFKNEEGKVETVTQSSLENVLAENKIYTAEYPYNSYVTVKNGDGKVKYYAAYDGTVKAGFDADKVKIDIDKENKKVTIRIPEVTISDVIVDENSVEIIFTNKKYDTETVMAEANSAAVNDLKEKTSEDSTLLDAAKENAEMNVRELYEPWLEQEDPDERYSLEVIVDQGTSPEK